jgi:hypothetical protein
MMDVLSTEPTFGFSFSLVGYLYHVYCPAIEIFPLAGIINFGLLKSNIDIWI